MVNHRSEGVHSNNQDLLLLEFLFYIQFRQILVEIGLILLEINHKLTRQNLFNSVF